MGHQADTGSNAEGLFLSTIVSDVLCLIMRSDGLRLIGDMFVEGVDGIGRRVYGWACALFL